MPRDTFPFENDRLVVFHFLAGGEHKSSHLSSFRGGKANQIELFLDEPMDAIIARVNDAGELIGVLNQSISKMHYIVKVQNYILQTLGDARRIEIRPVVRDLKYAGTTDVASAPFLDDIEMPINVPWVIAGRLTLLAYRATLLSASQPALPA